MSAEEDMYNKKAKKYVRGSGIGRTIEMISVFYTSILMWSPVFVFPLNYNSSFSVNPDLCPKLRNVHPERTKRSLSRTKLFCHNKTPIVQDVSLLSRFMFPGLFSAVWMRISNKC